MAPRACAVAAFVRPRFGTALAEWDLAIIDPLLVARLDAESLLGSAGRLVVAPYAIGKRPDPGSDGSANFDDANYAIGIV